MCGISGFVNNLPVEEKLRRVGAMTDAIYHRGPDDGWQIADQDMTFGFRRLSIIDVDGGRQPLANEDESIWVVFNGEIYNHHELRKTLRGHGYQFKTKSDTEVLVHGYHKWGVKLLDKIQGMFAFSIWDKRSKTLFAAVDRSGIKPFYYDDRDGFIFASEAKAILASGLVKAEINPEAVSFHMAYLWAPHPLTAFKGINKLAPGHYLIYKDGKTQVNVYWDLQVNEDYSRSESSWASQVHKELSGAVHDQMESEVPLGAFLSGGIDSSAVCKFLNDKNKGKPINTYFIGFSEEDINAEVIMDERPYARQMADALGSNHIEHDLTPDIEGLLKKLVWHMDEPIGDPAAISSYFVSEKASETLTVLLSGVGGDEVFAGYPRHLAMQLMGKYRKLPRFARSGIESLSSHLPGGKNALFRNIKKFVRSASGNEFDAYLQMLTYFNQNDQQQLFADDFYHAVNNVDITRVHRGFYNNASNLSPLARLQYMDFKTFLPCLNLMYTDKMSMAASIEVRVPFLHEPFVDSMFQLPPNKKIHGNKRKYIFKKAMQGDLPEEIIWRKKAGFGAPVHSWISGKLREVISDYLSPEKLKKQGIFNPQYIDALMKKEWSNQDYMSNHIWQLFVFQIWHEIFIEQVGSFSGKGLAE